MFLRKKVAYHNKKGAVLWEHARQISASSAKKTKMAKSIIKAEDVWKTYRMGDTDVHALRGLSLEIKKGEFVAIIGPSGSGKSTTMHIVGCLDAPTKGKVFLDGQDTSQMDENELAQIRGKKIGFVFQRFSMINTFTSLENVTLPMIFQGLPSEERNEKALKLLEKVGLAARADHRPSELSGGELQRVAIARALANDPEMILADEPTGNLDSKTGHSILSIFEKLWEGGSTIVIVTHDKEIAHHAQRIIMLKDGKVTGGKIEK